ncbi:MAG: ABC transporter ATP-binding protein [Geminicoccaceae bacterium]
MARIELAAVTKAWGDVVAVEPTDLVIEDGEFVAILGPSGCGKSTTLFMLAGLYAPTGGAIRFDDAVVNEVEARDRNVGIVFQSYALYPHMSVKKNIRFPLTFKPVAADEVERRVMEAARLVQVEELLEHMPAEMSGGQQQRVALARALVKEPQLLLLDEPLSNLDATLRLSMRGEIRRLQRRLGVTTVLVTHDQLEATTMADRIICMSKGRIEQIGTADDLYHRPDSLFVAGFIGSPPINLLDARGERGRLRVGEAELTATGVEGAVVLGVRPEHILLDAAGADPGGGMAGRIEHVEPLGRETLYEVDCALGHVHALESGSERRFRANDRVEIALAPDALLVFDGASGRRLADAAVGLAS